MMAALSASPYVIRVEWMQTIEATCVEMIYLVLRLAVEVFQGVSKAPRRSAIPRANHLSCCAITDLAKTNAHTIDTRRH
jgi:hypothetical protein